MCLVLPLYGGLDQLTKPFQKWTLEEALAILHQSPWARQQTFTQVVGGIGSGISGEKEIYSTFYVRFLSAKPIREAYARVRQIQEKYDELSKEEKKKLDDSLTAGLKLNVTNWIVVALTFRSNDPNVELGLKQFLEVQTSETIRARAFLSNARFPQIPPSAYFPPRDEVVGAKFVFPRRVDGQPVVSTGDEGISFELDVPGFASVLRVSFPVAEMMVKGEPVI